MFAYVRDVLKLPSCDLSHRWRERDDRCASPSGAACDMAAHRSTCSVVCCTSISGRCEATGDARIVARLPEQSMWQRVRRFPLMHLKSMMVAVAATFAVAAHGAQSTGPVVLKAAYLFDSKSGQLTQGGTVVVEGDKIVSIGAAAPGECPGDRSRRRDAAARLHRCAHVTCDGQLREGLTTRRFHDDHAALSRRAGALRRAVREAHARSGLHDGAQRRRGRFRRHRSAQCDQQPA